MQIYKKILYASEVAAIISTSTQTVYKMIRDGRIKAFKDEGGRAWRIPEEEVARYIQNGMNKNC